MNNQTSVKKTVFCVLAKMDAREIERFKQLKIDVDVTLVQKGAPKVERREILVCKKDNKRYQVEWFDDPGMWGEYTLYYAKELK